MTASDKSTLNASRQERFLKVVELLNSAHSYTRLGAVHALVALADEYLTDQALQAEEKHTEGQRIVDVLCAYIRSPFELTSHYYELNREELTGFYADSPEKFSADRAAFREEAHIRQTLIEKISDHMRWSLAAGVAELPHGYPEHDCVVPGNWSEFTYDFSGSVFFYPVDFVRTFWGETANFAGCTYFSRVQFSGSFFAQGALLCRSNYHEDTAFNGSYYAGDADFSGSLYHGANDFMGCAYGETASFKGSVFDGWAGFTDSSYSGSADFSASTYRAGCDFSSSRYRQQAIFENSFYERQYSTNLFIGEMRISVFPCMQTRAILAGLHTTVRFVIWGLCMRRQSMRGHVITPKNRSSFRARTRMMRLLFLGLIRTLLPVWDLKVLGFRLVAGS